MKTTCWEQSLIAFFMGAISTFVLILPLLPNDDDPTGGADFTTRQGVIAVGIVTLPLLISLALFATAYRYRKNKKEMWWVLIPAMVIFSLYLVFFFGGTVADVLR